MDRRAFLASTVAIAAATRYASAQNATKIPSIGWLTAQQASSLTPFLDAFRTGLAELGYVEDSNLKIEYRYGDDNLLRVAPLAAELNGLIEHNAEVVARARTHVSNLAHFLKTPLSVITTEASAQHGPLSDAVLKQVTTMRRQIDHYLARARAA